MAFDEHRALNPVPRAERIGVQVVERVGERTAVGPQVVVRVDDALVGVDDRAVDIGIQ
jgi:hypothetical protein